MASIIDDALKTTRRSLPLAVVPVVASLLSFSQVARALAADAGGGVAFPFPNGLPTLWTYVSLPAGPAGTGGGGPLSLPAFLVSFALGLLVTAALEAGFLGALSNRIDGRPAAFPAGVRRFTLRMVGVQLLRSALVFAVLPLFVVPPLALLAILVLSYLVYGLPFVIVVHDADFVPALRRTIGHATDGGLYASYGFGHLLAGAVASVVLSTLTLTAGLPGILLGVVIVAVPAVFVACAGLLVFRELGDGSPGPDEVGAGDSPDSGPDEGAGPAAQAE
ncbi:MAG: hypothetical protein ABEJ85_02480 [Haloarculaceae archaeon]